ncbi:hypothetical protein MSMEI_5745 [Mycolicibacterium smegmatis MC2 155]|uniref:Uncharacterized protein n=1 Tax=Mycolicibacterium smegmatis (strain ATCC 700084 / mc(2)155) TaxID=246196 RepID=I7GFV1_MYCS2|nr:hypothetical protein MSMEI_5745 [Mycolicibacterium smegmatis MC2 155]
MEPLDPAAQQGAAGVTAQRRRGTQHLHEQPVGLGGQLGAVHLGRRRVGRRRRGLGRGELPVDELEHLGLGVHAGQVELHPLRVDQSLAVHVLGVLRPLPHAVERDVDGLGRHERDPFVVELVGDQLPALVLLADQVGHRHAHVLVIGGAGVDAGHGVHGRPREALGRGRHDEHRDAAVLLGLGVGADREPHVVGVGDQAGPHLLAIDHVVVAVTHRGGAQRRQVGARARLGVADREVQFTRGDLGQEELLLFLCAERHDRRRDAVDGQKRHRRARDRGLVGEDQPVHGRAGLTAELLGPAEREPPVLAHLRDGLAVDVPAAHLAFGRAERLHPLRRHQLGEVRAQFATQLLLLGGVSDPHPLHPHCSSDLTSHPVVTRSSLGVQTGVWPPSAGSGRILCLRAARPVRAHAVRRSSCELKLTAIAARETQCAWELPRICSNSTTRTTPW